MSTLAHNPFLVSRLPVRQNAIKNILFRGATIVLTSVIHQLFAFLAFRKRDYTSYLMFAEDPIQKLLFARSRKFNRQAVLVSSFAALTFAAGFYDTLLWAVDSPGYIIKSKTVSAEVLAKQMIATPSYITFISNPQRDLNRINIQNIFGANLYSPGLNFTLPGIVDAGKPQPIPPLQPLSPVDVVFPRIWLDSTGFAVGVDETIMVVPDMNLTTFCAPTNVPPANATTPVTFQVWNCPLCNTDALAIFNKALGQPQYWWDMDTPSELLRPIRADNPWLGLSTGGGTALMKQIFMVTKGLRRHTFLQTTFKTTMISYAPMVFSDVDVKDFINRQWGNPNQTVTTAVQFLSNTVLQAQNNKTSVTFRAFAQQDEKTVTSFSTEYLYFVNTADPNQSPISAAMRFASTVITLVDSETLLNEPVPLAACNASATNIATGGVVRSMICAPPFNSTAPLQSQFLGQLDTTSMVIINDILGDGTKDTSAVALNKTGVDWYIPCAQTIEKLLTSRSLILDGCASKVAVDVQMNEAAISYLQLILIILPIFLALMVRIVIFRKPMEYYQNSFLAGVFATTHVIDSLSGSSEVGYMREPPEVVLKTRGEKVTLQMPDGELITVPGGRRASEHDHRLVFEPLIRLEKDDAEMANVAEVTVVTSSDDDGGAPTKKNSWSTI
jgi:hypothetical protein